MYNLIKVMIITYIPVIQRRRGRFGFYHSTCTNLSIITPYLVIQRSKEFATWESRPLLVLLLAYNRLCWGKKTDKLSI